MPLGKAVVGLLVPVVSWKSAVMQVVSRVMHSVRHTVRSFVTRGVVILFVVLVACNMLRISYGRWLTLVMH